jgi:hypothetical protein
MILLAFGRGYVKAPLLPGFVMLSDDGLRTKIFLTDTDFERLFGTRIAGIVGSMNAAARGVCPACNGYCCKNIHCAFYSESFQSCPIFDIRPRECRYHFCNDVFKVAPLTKEEKDMMQQPIEELICGNRGEIAQLFFGFPEFPLDERGLKLLGIWDSVERVKRDYEDGRLNGKSAALKLRYLCKE